jgi:hypothetical protein
VVVKSTILRVIGFEVITAVVTKCFAFWDITPCNQFKVNRLFGGKYRLHLQRRRVSYARIQREARSKQSLLFRMDAICSSETPVDFQRTTRRYIPENIIQDCNSLYFARSPLTSMRNVPSAVCFSETSVNLY